MDIKNLGLVIDVSDQSKLVAPDVEYREGLISIGSRERSTHIGERCPECGLRQLDPEPQRLFCV